MYIGKVGVPEEEVQRGEDVGWIVFSAPIPRLNGLKNEAVPTQCYGSRAFLSGSGTIFYL